MSENNSYPRGINQDVCGYSSSTISTDSAIVSRCVLYSSGLGFSSSTSARIMPIEHAIRSNQTTGRWPLDSSWCTGPRLISDTRRKGRVKVRVVSSAKRGLELSVEMVSQVESAEGVGEM